MALLAPWRCWRRGVAGAVALLALLVAAWFSLVVGSEKLPWSTAWAALLGDGDGPQH